MAPRALALFFTTHLKTFFVLTNCKSVANKQELFTLSALDLNSWSPLFYFLFLWIWLLQVPHISGIIQYLFFCVFTWHNVSNFIYVVACIKISVLLNLNTILFQCVYIYMSLCVCVCVCVYIYIYIYIPLYIYHA